MSMVTGTGVLGIDLNFSNNIHTNILRGMNLSLVKKCQSMSMLR